MMRPVTAKSDGRLTTAWLVLVALAMVGLGVLLKVRCLGPDGLTNAEIGVPWCYSDIAGLFQGRGLANDPLPYLQVMTEYPPLTALQWWLAGIGSTTVTPFFLITAAFQAIAAAVTVMLLRDHGLAPSRVLLFAAAPALLLTGTINWDLVAVALLTAGMVAAYRGNGRNSGILLGLGGLAKVFPLLAVPVVFWARARMVGVRTAAVGVIGGALTVVAAIQVPVALWAPGEWSEWISVNNQRAVDWDTIWFGIQSFTGQPFAPDLDDAMISGTILAGWVVIGLVGWRIGRHQVNWTPLVLVLPVVIWFLLAGKVYSPQFSLWILPLLAMSRVRTDLVWGWWITDVFVVLTRFPFLAGQQGLEPSLPYSPFALALAFRGVLMVLMLVDSMKPLPEVEGTLGHRDGVIPGQGVPAAGS